MKAEKPTPELLEARFPATRVRLPQGVEVSFRECGAGPTLVLLHGISSSSASWLSCALVLGEAWRVVAWDAPGYGDSFPLSAGMPSAAAYGERLETLLDDLRIDTCVLVGHSLGALMAAACARADVGRIRGLVLVSPARGYGAAGVEAKRRAVVEQRLEALESQGVAGIAERLPERMLSAGADPAAREWVRWNAARLHPAGYAQAVQMLGSADLMQSAPLHVPVEVLCGDQDRVTPPDACEAVADAFGAPFQLVADAGHASPIERPAALARAVDAAARRFFESGVAK